MTPLFTIGLQCLLASVFAQNNGFPPYGQEYCDPASYGHNEIRWADSGNGYNRNGYDNGHNGNGINGGYGNGFNGGNGNGFNGHNGNGFNGGNGNGFNGGNGNGFNGGNGNGGNGRFWLSERQGEGGGSRRPDWGSVIQTPERFGYRQVLSLSREQRSIRFRVRASRDAFIALHQSYGDTDGDLFEVHIGGFNNTRSVIRSRKLSNQQVSRRHSPLQQNSYRNFWISWDDNRRIRVGYGTNVDRGQFLTWRHIRNFPIRYMSISTGFGASGEWRIERNESTAIRIVTRDDLSFQRVDVLTQHLRERNEFPFYVKARNDAHILLQSSRWDQNNDVYEIVIGAQNNSRSEIRRGRNGRVVATARHEPLSENFFLPFWIRFRNGRLEVGNGVESGMFRFMSYNDNRPINVRHGSIATGNGSSGEWYFKPTP